MREKVSTEDRVREIRRKTRKKYSSEEKVRIVMEGLRGEESIAALCRREGIPSNLYYRWSKEFLEAGKKRLAGDTKREATSSEVTELRQENEQLKQSVALTSPVDATGLFELTQQPTEMLFPFEGMGADASWEFQMPKASNRVDFGTIADVLITIEYTALDSFDYRQQILPQLDSSFSADRPFSFRHQFADPWYDLHNSDQTATPMTVKFRTRREDFLPNIEDLQIQQVVLYFSRAGDSPIEEVEVTHLLFSEKNGVGTVGGGSDSIDGIISTRKGNAGSWTSMIGKAPIGEWEMALPHTVAMKNRFKNEEITDILFVITFSGYTPEWPK